MVDELRAGTERLDALDAGEQNVSIRTALFWSYRQLSDPAALMFRLLATYPRSAISLPAAARLSGLPAAPARAALAELAAAGLVIGNAAGHFSFHDLVRLYAAESCPTDLLETWRAKASAPSGVMFNGPQFGVEVRVRVTAPAQF